MSAQWGYRLSKSLLNQHRPTATGHGILSSLPFPCFFGSRLPAEVDITIKPSFIAAVPSRWCVSAILICLDLASSSFEAVDGATGDLIRCSQMRPAAAAVWIALFLPGKLVCVDTGSCLMTLLSFALAPLVVRLSGKVGAGLKVSVYLCLLLYYSFFQDLVLYLKLA
jgi:hypothetical protein